MCSGQVLIALQRVNSLGEFSQLFLVKHIKCQEQQSYLAGIVSFCFCIIVESGHGCLEPSKVCPEVDWPFWVRLNCLQSQLIGEKAELITVEVQFTLACANSQWEIFKGK